MACRSQEERASVGGVVWPDRRRLSNPEIERNKTCSFEVNSGYPDVPSNILIARKTRAASPGGRSLGQEQVPLKETP